jgi:hypothetical protein
VRENVRTLEPVAGATLARRAARRARTRRSQPPRHARTHARRRPGRSERRGAAAGACPPSEWAAPLLGVAQAAAAWRTARAARAGRGANAAAARGARRRGRSGRGGRCCGVRARTLARFVHNLRRLVLSGQQLADAPRLVVTHLDGLGKRVREWPGQPAQTWRAQWELAAARVRTSGPGCERHYAPATCDRCAVLRLGVAASMPYDHTSP